MDGKLHGDRVCWWDVETTSLEFENPRTLLLEVGLYVTTLDLEFVAQARVTIKRSLAEIGAANWEDAARDMHFRSRGGSGLAEDCLVSKQAVTIEEAERRLLRVVHQHTRASAYADDTRPGIGTADKRAPAWGGCSTLLDRMILRRDMPQLYGTIHYRTLDATSLKIAFEAWTGLKVASPSKPHRALEDAASSSRLANVFRRKLSLLGEGGKPFKQTQVLW